MASGVDRADVVTMRWPLLRPGDPRTSEREMLTADSSTALMLMNKVHAIWIASGTNLAPTGQLPNNYSGECFCKFLTDDLQLEILFVTKGLLIKFPKRFM